MAFLYYFAIPVLLYTIRKYREFTWGYFKIKKDLSSQVYIVTGATSGIGKEATKELLKRNATVIMASRDPHKIDIVYDEIKKSIPTGALIKMELDLASLDSIRKFCKEVLKRFEKIHVLINNAGVAIPTYRSTNDGFEMNFGVNHLGHFLLTNLLLDRLRESSPSRIIVVSSTLHEKGKIDFELLRSPSEEKYPKDKMAGYSNSKLANVYFCKELASRLEGSGVKVFSLCPGLCYTDIFRNNDIKWYQYLLFAPVAYFYMKSANQGCQSLLHCACSDDELKSGEMYRNCQVYKSAHKFEENIQKNLWTFSEQQVNLHK